MLIAFKMAYTLDLFQLRWKSKFSIFPPPPKRSFITLTRGTDLTVSGTGLGKLQMNYSSKDATSMGSTMIGQVQQLKRRTRDLEIEIRN